MPSPNSRRRISELEAKVVELTAMVERAATPAPAVVPPAVDEQRSSRRTMLKLAGATAVGTAVAAVARPAPVAAVDGGPVLIGLTNDTSAASTASTVLRYANTGVIPQVPAPIGTGNANMFTVRDDAVGALFNPSGSGNPAAVGGYSYGTTPNGVFGFTNMGGAGVVGGGNVIAIAGVYGRSGTTAVGAGAGVRAQSTNGPNILLEASATGAPTTGTWATGSLLADTTGRLWYCKVGGTPGTWVDLARALSVLNFFPLTPYRAYDSREALPSQGVLAKGSSRTIVIKDQRAVAGGAVTAADKVPAGAVAITANITVVNTVDAGFLTANPAGDTTINAATINWSQSGQILNNGVTLAIRVAGRDLTVIAGGGDPSSTDFVIDVTGYFAPVAI